MSRCRCKLLQAFGDTRTRSSSYSLVHTSKVHGPRTSRGSSDVNALERTRFALYTIEMIVKVKASEATNSEVRTREIKPYMQLKVYQAATSASVTQQRSRGVFLMRLLSLQPLRVSMIFAAFRGVGKIPRTQEGSGQARMVLPKESGSAERASSFAKRTCRMVILKAAVQKWEKDAIRATSCGPSFTNKCACC